MEWSCSCGGSCSCGVELQLQRQPYFQSSQSSLVRSSCQKGCTASSALHLDHQLLADELEALHGAHSILRIAVVLESDPALLAAHLEGLERTEELEDTAHVVLCHCRSEVLDVELSHVASIATGVAGGDHDCRACT